MQVRAQRHAESSGSCSLTYDQLTLRYMDSIRQMSQMRTYNHERSGDFISGPY